MVLHPCLKWPKPPGEATPQGQRSDLQLPTQFRRWSHWASPRSNLQERLDSGRTNTGDAATQSDPYSLNAIACGPRTWTSKNWSAKCRCAKMNLTHMEPRRAWDRQTHWLAASVQRHRYTDLLGTICLAWTVRCPSSLHTAARLRNQKAVGCFEGRPSHVRKAGQTLSRNRRSGPPDRTPTWPQFVELSSQRRIGTLTLPTVVVTSLRLRNGANCTLRRTQGIPGSMNRCQTSSRDTCADKISTGLTVCFVSSSWLAALATFSRSSCQQTWRYTKLFQEAHGRTFFGGSAGGTAFQNILSFEVLAFQIQQRRQLRLVEGPLKPRPSGPFRSRPNALWPTWRVAPATAGGGPVADRRCPEGFHGAVASRLWPWSHGAV